MRRSSATRSPGRQRGVPDRDALAQARAQAAQELGRQGDLGHQHQAPAAARPGRLDGLQVDLGLARAGDPVQQQRAPAGRRARRRSRRRPRPARRSAGAGRRAPGGRRRTSRGRSARAPPAPARIRPAAAMRRSVGRVVPARRQSSAAGSSPPPAAEGVEDLALGGRSRRRRARGRRAAGRRPAGAARGSSRRPASRRSVPSTPGGSTRRRQRASGRLVVARHPAGQVHELRRERRRGHDAGQRRQAALVRRRVAREHDAEHAPRAQGAGHERAGARGRVQGGGHGVVERPVEGARLDQQLDLRRGGGPRLGRAPHRGHPAVRPRRRRSGRPARRRRRCAPR